MGKMGAFERTVFWRQPALRFNGAPPQAVVRRGRWKYLRIGARRSLFDLAVDPGEARDRARSETRIHAELEQILSAWEATLPPAATEP
jgi:hypothetical protein